MIKIPIDEQIRRIKIKITTAKLRFRYHSIQMDYFDKKYIKLRKELVDLKKPLVKQNV